MHLVSSFTILPSCSDEIRVRLMKVNFASGLSWFSSSIRGLSLMLNCLTALLIDSTHGLPLVPNMDISAGVQPTGPRLNTTIFRAPKSYKVYHMLKSKAFSIEKNKENQ